MTSPEGGSATFLKAFAALFAVQFFSWAGMFALWIYAVPVVAGRVLRVDSHDVNGLQPALVVVSLCFALYATLGVAGSFALPGMVRRFGHGLTYAMALACGAAGLGLVAAAQGLAMLVLGFVAIGAGWAAMGSLPYSLLSKLAPAGKGGHYMRLFSFSTILPQVATTLLFAVVSGRVLAGGYNRAMIFGASAMGLGALVALCSRGLFAPADGVEDDW
ncbi:MAG: hypothetical protein KGL44_07600 [Sphingomonadales bacterium]|nr:hypothetical protein [Sphingomonadales bacterium]